MSCTSRLIAIGMLAVVSAAVAVGTAFAEITTLSLDPKGTLSADRTRATISGSITCTDGDSVMVYANVAQVVGRLLSNASGSTAISCTGEPQVWSVTAQTFGASTLRLAPGKASVGVTASDTSDFTATGGNHTILLKP